MTRLVLQSEHVALDLWRETPLLSLQKISFLIMCLPAAGLPEKMGGGAPTGAPTVAWQSTTLTQKSSLSCQQKAAQLPGERPRPPRSEGEPAPAHAPAGSLPRSTPALVPQTHWALGAIVCGCQGFTWCLKQSTFRIKRFNLKYLSQFISESLLYLRLQESSSVFLTLGTLQICWWILYTPCPSPCGLTCREGARQDRVLVLSSRSLERSPPLQRPFMPV